MHRWRHARSSGHKPNTTGYRADVRCVRHSVDLEALRRYAADGRPDVDRQARLLVGRRQCPACRPEYVGAYPATVRDRASAADAETFACICCGCAWTTEDETWVAFVDGGLQMRGPEQVPLGVSIDGTWFRVVAVDPLDCLESILRQGLAELTKRLPLPGEGTRFVDDIIDGARSAASGVAVLDTELAWVFTEHGVGDDTAWALQKEVFETVEQIQDLLTGAPLPLHVQLGSLDYSVRHGPSRAGERGDSRRGLPLGKEECQAIVDEVVASLPEPFATRFENVDVRLSEEEPEQDLWGLYTGIPTTLRAGVPYKQPDQITIYWRSIVGESATAEEASENLRMVVLHEIGHYFGIDDERLHDLGY